MAASDEPLEQFLAWHEREGRPDYTAAAGESVYSMLRRAFYAGYAAQAVAAPEPGALDEVGGRPNPRNPWARPFPAPKTWRGSREIGPAHPDYSVDPDDTSVVRVTWPGQRPVLPVTGETDKFRVDLRADPMPLEHVDTVWDGKTADPGREDGR